MNRNMTKEYEISVVTEWDNELREFLVREIPNINKMYGNIYNYENAMINRIIEKAIILVGKRNGEIRGIHISWLAPHIFDAEIRVLQQQLFYVMSNSGKMSYYLFNKFVDMGNILADHVITVIGSQTNIKPKTMNRYGFKELETLYRMENKRESR